MSAGNVILFTTVFFIIFCCTTITNKQLDNLDKRITNLELQTKVKHK